MHLICKIRLKPIDVALLTCAVSLASCLSLPKTERTQDLGYGYHSDVIAGSTASSAESVGHFEYLFYRDQRLAQSSKFAVAPSGEAIVYQDATSGNIFVFNQKRKMVKQLTSTFLGVVDTFIWDTNERYVTLSIAGQHGNVHKRRILIGDN